MDSVASEGHSMVGWKCKNCKSIIVIPCKKGEKDAKKPKQCQICKCKDFTKMRRSDVLDVLCSVEQEFDL